MKVSKETLKTAREHGVRRSNTNQLRKQMAKDQPLLTAALVQRYARVPYSAVMVYHMLLHEAEGTLPQQTVSDISKVFDVKFPNDVIPSNLENEQPDLVYAVKMSCYSEIPVAAKLVYEVFRSVFTEDSIFTGDGLTVDSFLSSLTEEQKNTPLKFGANNDLVQPHPKPSQAVQFGASKIQFYDETTGKTTEL